MKSFGIFLIIIGIICGYIALNMDTSVETRFGQQVNNFGLMNQQTNFLIGAGITFISGIMLIGIGVKSTYGKSSENHENNYNKNCTFCSKTIKKQAIICRYCCKEQTSTEIINPQNNCEKTLLKMGYKMIKKTEGWVVTEPLGKHAAINTFIKNYDELAEYTNSKISKTNKPLSNF